MKTTPVDNELPHDFEAEAAVLSCLLLDPSYMPTAIESIEPGYFNHPSYEMTYRAMLRLRAAGKPIDGTLLIGELRDAGQYDELSDGTGGVMLPELLNLFDLMPTAVNIGWYLRRMQDIARRRKAMVRGRQLINAARQSRPRGQTL